MGIKIRGKHLLTFALTLLILSTSLKTFAQSPPQTPIVRVAINNNSFQSYVYNEISVISGAEYFVLDKSSCKQLAKLNPTDVLKIKLTAGVFNLSVNGKNIAKDPENIIIDCPKGILGIENLKRNGKQAQYHGYFELNKKNDNQFFMINVIDLETYLKGVVPNEMPVRFGLEALKAQAIAARNYAMTPRTRSNKEFDVDDSVSSQVYFGANTEQELSNQAVAQTEGLVALHDWELILAQYSSTAGGYTESYENAFSEPKSGDFPAKSKPYLVGRPDIYSVAPLNREEEARIFYMSCPDSYDMKSPYYRWKKEWSATELHDVLQKTLVAQSKTGFIKPQFKIKAVAITQTPDINIIKDINKDKDKDKDKSLGSVAPAADPLGEIKEIKVKRRGVSGKIMEVEIVTDKETYHVFKELVIRRLFQKNGVSLPSANVVFDNLYDTDKKLNKVVAYGGGFGHGVGMSQYGAGFMATSLHKSFDKILKRYYTGITISTCPVILSNNDAQKEISQTFYAPYKKALVVVDNKYQIARLKGKINGRDVVLELANSIVPIHRISRIDVSSYIKAGKNNVTFYYPDKEGSNKAIRLYIELVEKDNDNYNF